MDTAIGLVEEHVTADSKIDSSEKPYTFTFKRFIKFLERYPLQLLISVFFLLLAFGQKLFSNSFSIDTQSIISAQSSLYGSWYSIGRFGLVLLKKIFGVYQYNNALASFLAVVLFGISALIWAYLFYEIIEDKKSFYPAAFLIPVLTAPIFAEILGFLLQGPEISIASLLIALSLMLLADGTQNNVKLFQRVILVFFSICFAAFAFSIYQAMVTIFVSGAAMYYFFRYGIKLRGTNRQSENEELSGRQMLLADIGVFVFSYLIYSVANILVMRRTKVQEGSYASGQVMWGHEALTKIGRSIQEHFVSMYTVGGTFYSILFTVLAIALILITVFQAFKKRATYFGVLVSVLIVLSPMLMTVILGTIPAVRTEMTYPFAFGFVSLALAMWISVTQLKWRTAVVWIMILVIGWTQGLTTNRIFYTENIVFSQDVLTAQEIKTRIDLLGLGEVPTQPVVFIGNHGARRNQDCLNFNQLSLVGQSMLEIGFSTKHGTEIKNQFIDSTLGVQYALPSSEQIKYASRYSKSMQNWPAKDSVQSSNGVIIVKFN